MGLFAPRDEEVSHVSEVPHGAGSRKMGISLVVRESQTAFTQAV